MIEILSQSTDTCLAVHFSGKVTADEYQHFLTAVDERLAGDENISLVVDLTGFEAYSDFATVREDFKFAFDEYRHVHRAALVSDQKWVEWFTRLIGPFTRAEEMHFTADQFQEAINWATA